MNTPLWQIEYSLEARNYIYDSYPYTKEIILAIEALSFDKDAIPPEGCTPTEEDTYMTIMLGHLVVYQKLPNAQPKPMLWIAVIKPME